MLFSGLLKRSDSLHQSPAIDGALVRNSLRNIAFFSRRGTSIWDLVIRLGEHNDLIPNLCQWERINVTISLGTALRHSRDQNAVKMLWIDAISINQRDIEERDKQVPLMERIYSSAIRELLWLGEDHDWWRCRVYPLARKRGVCRWPRVYRLPDEWPLYTPRISDKSDQKDPETVWRPCGVVSHPECPRSGVSAGCSSPILKV
jgi:hypothetical protein